MSATSETARMVEAVPTAVPASFDGDLTLFTFNLFLMTAMTFLGLMMAGKQAQRIWLQRFVDHPLHPISLYRVMLFLWGAAVAIRCGAEALHLWGHDPLDPALTARVLMAKRWLDPVAVGLAAIGFTIAILGEPGLEHQLRKAPLPVDMWSRWPSLVRAAGVIALSFIAAVAAVVLR